MTQPATAPAYSNARRNRTFALGVAAGAVLMMLLTFAVGATGSTPRRQATAALTVTATGASSGDCALIHF